LLSFATDVAANKLEFFQEVDRLVNEVKALQHENGLLKGELRDAKDASEKAPSAVMSALVDKLRIDQVKQIFSIFCGIFYLCVKI
jgi:hypothetical protein